MIGPLSLRENLPALFQRVAIGRNSSNDLLQGRRVHQPTGLIQGIQGVQ